MAKRRGVSFPSRQRYNDTAGEVKTTNTNVDQVGRRTDYNDYRQSVIGAFETLKISVRSAKQQDEILVSLRKISGTSDLNKKLIGLDCSSNNCMAFLIHLMDSESLVTKLHVAAIVRNLSTLEACHERLCCPEFQLIDVLLRNMKAVHKEENGEEFLAFSIAILKNVSTTSPKAFIRSSCSRSHGLLPFLVQILRVDRQFALYDSCMSVFRNISRCPYSPLQEYLTSRDLGLMHGIKDFLIEGPPLYADQYTKICETFTNMAMLKPQHSLSRLGSTNSHKSNAPISLSLLGSIDKSDVSDYLDGFRRLIVKYNSSRKKLHSASDVEARNRNKLSIHESCEEDEKKALLKACETVYALSSSRFSSSQDRVRLCYAENGVILAMKDVIRNCAHSNDFSARVTTDMKILNVVLQTILAVANEPENLTYLRLPEVGLVRELENVASFSSEAQHALKRIHEQHTFSSGTVVSLGTTFSNIADF